MYRVFVRVKRERRTGEQDVHVQRVCVCVCVCVCLREEESERRKIVGASTTTAFSRIQRGRTCEKKREG